MPLYLKNPHSILAVLEIRPQDIFEIRLPTAHAGDTWEAVRTAAQEIGIKIAAPETGGRNPRRNPRDKRRSPGRIGVAEAVVKDHPGVALEALFSGIKASEPGLWIALDTVQDPQNLGAIFRAAAFFNVRGIVLTRARSAPLNGTAYDVASGGVEYVPFSVQTNLSRTLDLAKDRGLWVLGASPDFPGPHPLIIKFPPEFRDEAIVGPGHYAILFEGHQHFQRV